MIGVQTRPRRDMREKAHQNLRIARALIELGLFDAAASRLYYAAFQATIFAFERKGLQPRDFRPAGNKWEHWMVIQRAPLTRGRPADALLLRDLRRLRNKADYGGSGVDPMALRDLAGATTEFVREVTR